MKNNRKSWLIDFAFFNRSLLAAFFLLFAIAASTAQETHWYEGLFIEVSAIRHPAPEMLSEYIRPGPGFRGALGYEYKRFRFAAETGFARITGTDPLVAEVSLVPLVFKFGYELPFSPIFGLRADAGLGFVFSRVSRYESAFDMALGNRGGASGQGLTAGARLYATATPLRFLTFYAGGGAEFLFETDGAIPLPLLEAGVSFRPLAMAIPAVRQRKARSAAGETVLESHGVELIIE